MEAPPGHTGAPPRPVKPRLLAHSRLLTPPPLFITFQFAAKFLFIFLFCFVGFPLPLWSDFYFIYKYIFFIVFFKFQMTFASAGNGVQYDADDSIDSVVSSQKGSDPISWNISIQGKWKEDECSQMGCKDPSMILGT